MFAFFPNVRLLSLAVFLVACSDEPGSLDEAGALELMSAIEGEWNLESMFSSDCGYGIAVNTWSGHSDWEVDGRWVLIQTNDSSAESVFVEAIDSQNLVGVEATSLVGCKVEAHTRLVVEDLDDSLMQGTLHHRYIRSNGPSCTTLAAAWALPETCESTTRWVARRLTSP
jgi:hypothetical protein